MYKLGIDIGAASCQYVLMDEHGSVKRRASVMHHNRIRSCLLDFADAIAGEIGSETEVQLAICGTMKHLAGLKEKYSAGEALSLCRAAAEEYPQAGSYIVIGAQKTMYIVPSEGKEPEIRHNSNCSSGTGSFFEEQAGRLQIPLEEISDTVSRARTVPQIAGRCSVFSKTDIIHHMQEGVSTPDLLLGLCYALVRNYKASILRNRPVTKPVLLCGGVMRNAGVITALKELLSLSEGDYILPEEPVYLPAEGCAMSAVHTISVRSISEGIRSTGNAVADSGLPPLYPLQRSEDKMEFPVTKAVPGPSYLGIDIGSTSINLVLINEEKEVLYYSYVRNTGSPLDIVNSEIRKMKRQLPEGTELTEMAVTGSGREYVGQQIGAGLVINEITAQTEGSTLFSPDTDTIFEIGGQDSKYMFLQDGRMTDFEMNKVCAAGTGAFLEEQIRKLGLSMEEFLELSMKSEHPCELGDRCTVFIESSITKALAEGHSMADVCAGLAYAIVSNYLHRVVNLKPIGDNIAIQGGIAYNEAVICAFRALTGRSIRVSPYFSVTGALGAASLCTNSHYLNFDREHNRAVNQKLRRDTEQSYLGDYREPDGNRPVIGIPRVIFLHKMFPLFRTMFTALGYDVLLSPLSDREIVSQAQRYSMEETCYPIKLINGHIAWLLEHNVHYIFLPRLYTIRHKGSIARRDYSCMYMQTSPLLMEQTFHFADRGVTLISPELSLQFGKKYMLQSILSIGRTIGRSRAQMIPAAMKGMKALFSYSDRLEELAADFLDTDEPVFVMVSRVYNIIDPVLNMGIEDHLNSLGCRVIHLEHLEASCMNVDPEYASLYWPFGQHMLTAMKIIRKHRNLYPIYITNHGCGPDTALQHYIKRELEGRDYLHLEVDEHTSRVGVITRLEAFLYSLRPGTETSSCAGCTSASCKTGPEETDTVLIPDLGIYSRLLRTLVPEGKPIRMLRGLEQHRSFNYAINKEYYSMLVMLEELLDQTEDGHRYELLMPTDEGSEVFGQYGRLFEQELNRLGRTTVLSAPYIEDFPGMPGCRDHYLAMIWLELSSILHEGDPGPVPDGIRKPEILHLAAQVQEKLLRDPRAKILALGEPVCVFKDSILGRNTGLLGTDCLVLRMPLSELLLFHLTDTDRKGKWKDQTDWMRTVHDEIAAVLSEGGLFTPFSELHRNIRQRISFCVGDGAKYRVAKLLSLEREHCSGVLLVHSNEENVSVIIKSLLPAWQDVIRVPVCRASMDFEHALSEEDAETFLHYLAPSGSRPEETEPR